MKNPACQGGVFGSLRFRDANPCAFHSMRGRLFVSNQKDRSPNKIVSPFRQTAPHSGRKSHSGSCVRIGTRGKSFGTTQSNLAPERKNSISHPRPRTFKQSLLVDTTRPRTSKKLSLPMLPDTCSKDDWCFSWMRNCKKSSVDERSFVIVLKSYGFEMARSVAVEQGWDCQHLIAEARRRGF